jgi:putative radical SAM enzyme (TIGR03279 family)
MLRVITSQDSRIPENATLVTIDNQEIEDVLEFRFYNDITRVRKVLINTGRDKRFIIFKPHEQMMIDVEEPRYRTCENNCHFCFINGLPKGLRKELYFRDDDYRLSFLFGNFLSLTNVSTTDILRIARLKLSPLYVSVHTTDPRVRAQLFKNEKAGLIMNQLSSLIDNNVRLHCQIVVIPGVTDGAHVVKTITDLSELYPGVASIGVVPVGKTKYLKSVTLVSKKLARETISIVDTLHKQFRKKYNVGLVYCADEFYIKAGFSIPEVSYYDDFPQYENGIGMVRQLIDEVVILDTMKKTKGNFLFLTSNSALPFLHMLKMKLIDLNCINSNNIDVTSVENSFFGKTVTVSGLIGARDFTHAILNQEKNYDRIILPPHCVNDSNQFIDGKTLDDRRVLISPQSLKELVKCLQ